MGEETSGFDLRGTLRDVLGAAVEWKQAEADYTFWNNRAPVSQYTPQPAGSATAAASTLPAKLSPWVWPVGLGLAVLLLFVALKK